MPPTSPPPSDKEDSQDARPLRDYKHPYNPTKEAGYSPREYRRRTEIFEDLRDKGVYIENNHEEGAVEININLGNSYNETTSPEDTQQEDEQNNSLSNSIKQAVRSFLLNPVIEISILMYVGSVVLKVTVGV